ncbi:hypothetical protein FOZ63_018360, partial [Perkinsus olseni]
SELFESVAPKFFGLQLLVLRAFKCAGQRSASSALYSDILRLLSSLPLCKAGIGAASSFEQNNNGYPPLELTAIGQEDNALHCEYSNDETGRDTWRKLEIKLLQSGWVNTVSVACPKDGDDKVAFTNA